jgi:hypothetical protein
MSSQRTSRRLLSSLIAATIAGIITFTFARVQARIAQSQRDIALDKLKFDLFRNRYEIYEATKALLEYMPYIHESGKQDASKIRSLYVKIDEARFYFPPDICAVLNEIHNGCERFFAHLAKRDTTVDIGDRVEWSRLADILANDQKALRTAYASLPQTFEKTLAFKQLTTVTGP